MNFSKQQLLTVAVILLAGLSVYLLATRNGAVAPSVVTEGERISDTTKTAASAGVKGETAAPNTTGAKPAVAPSAAPTGAPSLSGKLAPELVHPGGYSNGDPFLLRDFIGKKVVLLQFWTTSSEETERTIPYLTDWYSKYKNYGLVIVAVHTPRFQFERSKTIVDDYVKQRFGAAEQAT